jgi:hypothetical protein
MLPLLEVLPLVAQPLISYQPRIQNRRSEVVGQHDVGCGMAGLSVRSSIRTAFCFLLKGPTGISINFGSWGIQHKLRA